MTSALRLAALKTESERLKARLDRLNAQIEGDHDAWWTITTNMPESVAEVLVDKVLAEARQTALAYATVCKTIVALEGDGEKVAEVDPLDEVRRRREEKRAIASRVAASDAIVDA